MERAAVIIGVNKTGNLATLQAAVSVLTRRKGGRRGRSLRADASLTRRAQSRSNIKSAIKAIARRAPSSS